MRRALASAALAAAMVAAAPAHADCTEQVSTLRAKLSQIVEAAKRQEAALLLNKAQIDGNAGRNDLCTAAVQRAALVGKLPVAN